VALQNGLARLKSLPKIYCSEPKLHCMKPNVPAETA